MEFLQSYTSVLNSKQTCRGVYFNIANTAKSVANIASMSVGVTGNSRQSVVLYACNNGASEGCECKQGSWRVIWNGSLDPRIATNLELTEPIPIGTGTVQGFFLYSETGNVMISDLFNGAEDEHLRLIPGYYTISQIPFQSIVRPNKYTHAGGVYYFLRALDADALQNSSHEVVPNISDEASASTPDIKSMNTSQHCARSNEDQIHCVGQNDKTPSLSDLNQIIQSKSSVASLQDQNTGSAKPERKPERRFEGVDKALASLCEISTIRLEGQRIEKCIGCDLAEIVKYLGSSELVSSVVTLELLREARETLKSPERKMFLDLQALVLQAESAEAGLSNYQQKIVQLINLPVERLLTSDECSEGTQSAELQRIVDNRNNTRMDFMAKVKGAISHHSSVIVSVQKYLRDLEILLCRMESHNVCAEAIPSDENQGYPVSTESALRDIERWIHGLQCKLTASQQSEDCAAQNMARLLNQLAESLLYKWNVEQLHNRISMEKLHESLLEAQEILERAVTERKELVLNYSSSDPFPVSILISAFHSARSQLLSDVFTIGAMNSAINRFSNIADEIEFSTKVCPEVQLANLKKLREELCDKQRDIRKIKVDIDHAKQKCQPIVSYQKDLDNFELQHAELMYRKEIQETILMSAVWNHFPEIRKQLLGSIYDNLNSNCLLKERAFIMYKIICSLGNGPARRRNVYKATFPGSDIPCVLKEFKVQQHKWERRALCREVGIFSRLAHPNIIRINCIFFDEIQGCAYIETPYYSGDTLTEWMKLSPSEWNKRSVLHQVLRAIEHLHNSDIVHCDLKPQNIVMNRRSVSAVPLIVDFDKSISVNERGRHVAQIVTQSGSNTVVGTLGYIAPELCDSNSNPSGLISPAIDIYSFGVVMFEVVFPGLNDTRKLGLPPSIPSEGDAVTLSLLKTLLSKDPNDRPSATTALSHEYFVDSSSEDDDKEQRIMKNRIEQESLHSKALHELEERKKELQLEEDRLQEESRRMSRNLDLNLKILEKERSLTIQQRLETLQNEEKIKAALLECEMKQRQLEEQESAAVTERYKFLKERDMELARVQRKEEELEIRLNLHEAKVAELDEKERELERAGQSLSAYEDSIKSTLHWEKSQLDKERQDLTQEKIKLEQQEEEAKAMLSPPPHWSLQAGVAVSALTTTVDVTTKFRDLMQTLFDRTCVSKYIGKGRDAFGLTHTSFKVVKVTQLESCCLWKLYAVQRAAVIANLPTGSRHQDMNVITKEPWMKSMLHSSDLGEVFLFHGTKANLKDVIMHSGFDERVANLGGLFGAGVYFAENSSKSDEYCTPDSSGSCYMFLSRVMLGTPFLAEQPMSQLRRPPNLHGSNRLCDSVIGVTKATHPSAFLERYREFIVYDRRQAYPELLIEFKRV